LRKEKAEEEGGKREREREREGERERERERQSWARSMGRDGAIGTTRRGKRSK
jgi:hypothetical protein